MVGQVSKILSKDWSDKLKKFIAFFLLAITLSGCGYQGWVRYPCQEFENWKKPECNPPQCIPTGTCTKDILPGVLDEPKK
jgi:predicted small lipoprotein YifL